MVSKKIEFVNTVAYGDVMTKKTPLSAIDWIMAGFRALTTGGPQAIKVEPIARQLNVSKGSFYWHFKDVFALKTAMLDHWMSFATQGIIETVEDRELRPKDQLRLLVQISTSDLDEPYGGPMAEAAIRDWARYDENAARALKDVDQTRLKYLETLFKRSGTDSAQTKVFSSILYAALIGLQQLAHHDLADQKNDLSYLLEQLLLDQHS